jgi:hypothetical protein
MTVQRILAAGEGENNLSSFDTVEIMFEFSKAIRHGVIALESLNDLEGVDPKRVIALAASVRHAHEEATAYMVALIGVNSITTERLQPKGFSKSGGLSSE